MSADRKVHRCTDCGAWLWAKRACTVCAKLATGRAS